MNYDYNSYEESILAKMNFREFITNHGW